MHLPADACLALFLFGIEKLAFQLEELFSILSIQKHCDEVKQSTLGMIEWSTQSRKKKSNVSYSLSSQKYKTLYGAQYSNTDLNCCKERTPFIIIANNLFNGLCTSCWKT
jgi:hypothetical protein